MTAQTPVLTSSSMDIEDLFTLDITFIEHGPNANMVIAMTDDNCGTTCPSACTTSSGV